MNIRRQTVMIIQIFAVGIVTLTGWWLVKPITIEAQQGANLCGKSLPAIEWLGEGPNSYSLGKDFDTFIVKRLPFQFVLEGGTPDVAGAVVYQAVQGERVWRCSGDCQLPAVYHDAYSLGDLTPGTRVNMVVIDDDDDNRHNWWAVNNPLDPHLVVDDQQMVESLTFDVPTAGAWYYYANDSIGIAATCFEPLPPTPTTTVTTTPSPGTTATPTVTPTTTPTTIVVEPPETITPTTTPTATATPPSTLTPTATPPVLPTISITPSVTPDVPPTALNLLYFRATADGEQLEVTWETAFELQVQAFQLWRGTTNNRADAQLLTPTMIPSRGTAGSGAVYRYKDANVVFGTEYTYWLVAVNADGDTEELDSTIGELLQSIYLPILRR